MRHNLSLNKCFEKVEKLGPSNGNGGGSAAGVQGQAGTTTNNSASTRKGAPPLDLVFSAPWGRAFLFGLFQPGTTCVPHESVSRSVAIEYLPALIPCIIHGFPVAGCVAVEHRFVFCGRIFLFVATALVCSERRRVTDVGLSFSRFVLFCLFLRFDRMPVDVESGQSHQDGRGGAQVVAQGPQRHQTGHGLPWWV